MTTPPPTTKPAWPASIHAREGVRMTAHPNGQWCKKIAGRLYYFGTWAGDVDAGAMLAVADYRRRVHAIERGGDVHVTPPDAITVHEVVNRYLAAKLAQMQAGDLSSRTYADYACRGQLRQPRTR